MTSDGKVVRSSLGGLKEFETVNMFNVLIDNDKERIDEILI